ncbi:hypothetical protein [Lactococcus lactis]|uniref:hypothetical protein n=1 Tax=Lactococcus lactis TaxID=1358 RepID=UPI0003472E8E|nr:hypothetical protein [Lactococcus lactis]QOK51453.1 hypothetical protein HZ322_12245 [Lactococcus lactis]
MKKTISGILLATGAISLSLILASTVHSKEKVNAYVPKNEQKIIKENPKLLKLKNLPFENKRTKRMISFQSQKIFDSFLSNQKNSQFSLYFTKILVLIAMLHCQKSTNTTKSILPTTLI